MAPTNSSQISSDHAVDVLAVEGCHSTERTDRLAVEEPLAIVIGFGPLRNRQRTTLSITMRTPGHDKDLAAGFLFTESVIQRLEQIIAIEAGLAHSAVQVEIHPDVEFDLGRLARRGYTSSSCGICGKISIEAVEAVCTGPATGGEPIPPDVIHALPARLRDAQAVFASTGGLHAAALFDRSGQLLAIREDVGRHNAVDKLIGAELRARRVPLTDCILLVSGRASFELIQKAAMAAAPVFAAVGAPSSLAVDLANRLGVTLLGFVREGRFNIYSGANRILV
jgi:FdhD protein